MMNAEKTAVARTRGKRRAAPAAGGEAVADDGAAAAGLALDPRNLSPFDKDKE